MTPSTYIPITPATRIPFPCWLWDTTEPARWVSYHKPICGDYRAESSCFIEFGFTHYCTSATEPTGRPESDEVGVTRSIETARKAREAMNKIPLDDPRRKELYESAMEIINASHPAVPTASGATGDALKAWIKQCRDKFGHSAFDGKDQWWIGYFEVLKDLERFVEKSASRPAVAQEGVRDTERLDWLLKKPQRVQKYDRYSDCSHQHIYTDLKDRAAIDAAMSIQPEGRG